MAAKTKFTSPASVRFPKNTLKALDKLARQLAVPRSALIIEAVESLLSDPPVARPRPVVPAGGDRDVFE